MATNGKPSTRFTITYGDLPAESSGGSLTPVIVGPRYAVHKLEDGYETTSMGTYDINADEPKTKFDFPGYMGGKLDADSCKLYAVNGFIQISDADSVAGAVTADTPSLIETAETVRPVVSFGTTTTTENVGLNGYVVAAGDKVKISNGEISAVATVIDVLPKYKTPDPTIEALETNTGTLDISGLTLTADAVTVDCAYLVKVVSVDSAAGTASIEVRAIAGDSGYYVMMSVEKDVPVTIGSADIALTFDDTQIAALAVGDTFILKAFAKKIEIYNKVYVDADLTALAGNVDVEVYKAIPGSSNVVLNTGYWDIEADGVKVSEVVRVTVGTKQFQLVSSDLHLEYRELVTESANRLISTNSTRIGDIVGVADPLNPIGLAYSVFTSAASGLGGATAFMCFIDEDSDAGYSRALERVGRYEDAYGLVPLTTSEGAKAAVKSVISTYSRPEVAQFKCGWLTTSVTQERDILTTDDTGVAVIGSVVNGELKILSGNLIEKGVRVGDVVYVSGGIDDDTVNTAVTATVVRVTSTTTAEVDSGSVLNSGIGCVRIVRKMSASEYAEAIAAEAASINNYRIKLIAADTVNFGGFEDIGKEYLAVACAAMRAALPPHAPLTDRTLDGFTITENVGWSEADLETMNYGGVWVVYNDIDGAAKNYHQITTRTDGTIAEEDSAVSNGDSIVRELRTAIRPLASGSSNASLQVIGKIEAKIHAVMAAISSRSYADELGPQVEDYQILALYRPEGNRQRIIGRLSITGQLPLQDGEFSFNLI